MEHAIAHIEEAITGYVDESMECWYAVKLFERDEKVQESLKLDKGILDHILFSGDRKRNKTMKEQLRYKYGEEYTE